MEKVIAEKNAEAKRLEELREQERKAEQNLKFQEMFNNPESDLYKECYNSLNEFGKRCSRIGGRTFEAAMKKAYSDLLKKNEEEFLKKETE